MIDTKTVTESFFLDSDVTRVARGLLGKILYTEIDNEVTAGMIVETEAYSYREAACHAHLNRRTKRTRTLFARGGTAYVYLCYGIHHLFNIVTNDHEVAEAVLVRAVQPIEGEHIMQRRRGPRIARWQLTSGPGKLSMAMGITTALNGEQINQGAIRISSKGTMPDSEIICDVRIGVDYAGQDALLPCRFMIKDNPFISVPPQKKNAEFT